MFRSLIGAWVEIRLGGVGWEEEEEGALEGVLGEPSAGEARRVRQDRAHGCGVRLGQNWCG